MSHTAPFDPTTPLGGRYRLREPVGEGGFAVTYLAEDLVLGRMVAVKVLRARYGGDAATAARFEREARAAAAVSSPYIVDVFDYGTDRGVSYIVLQYVPGPTLRDVISQAGRLSPHDSVAIAIDILRGLAVIHDAGIVHRDVKPQNVLIDRHGTARVTDFGVALWAGAETLTSHGMAVGTAVYMAPEQALGNDVTPAADLYAVGVLLFEMLTGLPPFRGDSPAALLMAHVHQEPPLPSEIVPGLASSVALEREVMRALAKSPADRRPGARAMAHALEAAIGSITPGGKGVSPTPGDTSTATVPALAPRGAPTPTTEGTMVSSGVGPKTSLKVGPWVAPLLLLVGALVALVLITVNGGFGGLAGLLDPDGQTNRGNIAGLATSPPTTAATSTNEIAANPDSSGDAGAAGTTDTETPVPTPAATGDADRPLFEVWGESGLGATRTPAASTETPIPQVTPTPPTAAVESIAVDSTSVVSEPAEDDQENVTGRVITGDPGAGIQFQSGDWEGAGEADPDLGRNAVALYGADGDAGRGVLRFNLPAPPESRMVLTLTGLGDETGMPFPFGIEVNGMYVGQSPTTFANWHPARDGLHGEQAAWDQVRINLPPEVFQAGSNEIAIVSLAPGDYDDRVPYLLLSDATLAPE